MSADPRAVVWREAGEPLWLAERSRRALVRTGVALAAIGGRDEVASVLRAADGPVWLLRAGAWPVRASLEPPRASATGRLLLALGAVLGDSDAALAWRRAVDPERAWPPALSVWLEAPLAMALAALLDGGLEPALARLREACRPRVVRAAGLDVEHDPRLRVAEVVTSVQQGGAERVALDLSTALPSTGVAAHLVAVGAPTRAVLPRLSRAARLEWDAEGPGGSRLRRLGSALVAHGTDVAHAHLLGRDEIRELRQSGIPLVATLHNEAPGWPGGMARLRPDDATLLVACSRAVERDVVEAGLEVPHRTVWNGIDTRHLASSAADGHDWRERLGFGAADFVLVAVANPRPQKRLERLPAVLAGLRARLAESGVPREARLVVAGSPSLGSPRSAEARDELARAVTELALADHVRLAGSVEDVGSLLRASNAFVSTSAHEGLSLAQIEALACDLPVVATEVGGAPELAARVPGVSLVGRDAEPAAFVPPLVRLARSAGRPASAAAVSREFGLPRMADDYARLLRSAARAGAGGRRRGLLVVTNNFSTGGAQSSARRLLVELQRRGLRVRAAVLQEQPAHPTPGRRALEALDVPVLAVPPPAQLEPARAVDRILGWIAADPPEAVVLWNVIVEHKLLLADTLFDVPVFDVSPGEMYFESLARYFAAPRPGLPYGTPAEYGERLAGVIVKYSAEAARAEALGAPVHVIPNGVAIVEGARRRPAGGPLRIGTLARLDPRKRLDRLLRALRLAAPRLPPHVLRIAGGPEPGSEGYIEELRGLAEGLSVELLGERDAGELLPDLDLFALVAEPAGCPNASLEAMAHGVPVVATDAGGVAEQIVDGVSGRLVPRADERALAAALVELGADEDLRVRLGAAGQERVRERFSLRSMADAYAAVVLGAPARTLALDGNRVPTAAP